jgi:hypothetical protein
MSRRKYKFVRQANGEGAKSKVVSAMKFRFQILLLLPLIILSGCVGYVFGVYLGCYSRVEFSTAARTFVLDTNALQKEVDKTLTQNNFRHSPAGQPALMEIKYWMSWQENLSPTNCVAEWLREKRSFWSSQDYSVQMFFETNTISFVILTGESGSRKEAKKIQGILIKSVEDKFPNYNARVNFRSLVTAMPP